ncbi:MAG: phosphopantothenoylcysteine decarboxylase [Candidatus Nanoarchaeia archaeon]|nr:phosphopantothenoylcysteine decarboxylase [Candidatus Nanoarchaeia archaeon]MDD5740593.1 phosphopantothenoylcysteine decarboxylase [Candidatus Nanoarchaeia archaeon]
MPKLEVIITSGGTVSKIDDVRHIGNFSSGTTGSLIAEEFLKSGAVVHYVYCKNAKRPFIEKLKINVTKPKAQELERLSNEYDKFKKYCNNLHEYPVETFEEYHSAIRKILTEKPIDTVVLAAAVSDYSAVPIEGKISSDKENLTIELKKNPKIISLIKEYNPKVFQVGFKLLSRAGIGELIDTAYAHGLKNHSDLTVANTSIDGNFANRKIIFITPEKGLIPVSMRELAPKLVEILNTRISKLHYRTELHQNTDFYKTYAEQIQLFMDNVKKLWKLNLFESYFKDAKYHFGSYSIRLPDGFLITARKSDKENMPLEDIVYVSQVDFCERKLIVNSAFKKASLNANLIAKIFAERPDINMILHAHVQLNLENKTKTDFSPGTQEDIEEVIPYLKEKNLVELKNHGIISLGRNLDEIISSLYENNVYTRNPEVYDLVYKRFQDSDDFINLILKQAGKNKKILDLAAGTGELSLQLLNKGYKNISLADRSKGMLDIAKKKLDLQTYTQSMEDLSLKERYDLILVRQAINYLMDKDGLLKAFSKIYNTLNPNGKFIFNSFNYKGSIKQEFVHNYDYKDYDVNVREMNTIENKSVIHTQNCELIKLNPLEIKKIYDINKFRIFTKEEFEQALVKAGFSDTRFFGKNLEEYTPESKSLYCVAKKN